MDKKLKFQRCTKSAMRKRSVNVRVLPRTPRRRSTWRNASKLMFPIASNSEALILWQIQIKHILQIQLQKSHFLWPLRLIAVRAFQAGHEMRSVRFELVGKIYIILPNNLIIFSHIRCEKHMPNLCGVNQKQLSDALLEIKRNASSASSPGATKDQQMVNGVGHKFKVEFVKLDIKMHLKNIFPEFVPSPSRGQCWSWRQGGERRCCCWWRLGFATPIQIAAFPNPQSAWQRQLWKGEFIVRINGFVLHGFLSFFLWNI